MNHEPQGRHPLRWTRAWRPVLGAALLTAALAGGAGLVYAAWPSNVTVTFNGATYDYNANTTTFSYEVAVDGGQALSHITLGVCADVVPDGVGSGPENQDNPLPGGGTWRITPDAGSSICQGNTIDAIVGNDTTTGVRGIKFECAGGGEFQDPGETATYEYTVSGIWAVDDSVLLGAKAGTAEGSQAVGGPDCDSIDLLITTSCADFTSPDPVYESTITNRNGNAATNVEFTDQLPPDIRWAGTYASSCPSCGTVSCTSDDPANPETVTCTLTELAAGSTWTISLDVVDQSGEPTPVTHVVSVSADEAEQFTANNEDACAQTTPVTLSYFLAEPREDGVRFSWSTSTETGNIGFRILSRDGDGRWLPVTPDIVPSAAGDSLSRLDYTLFAENVVGDVFLIEDIDVTTRVRRHGPFALGEPYGRRATADRIDWAGIRAEHERKSWARQRDRLDVAREALDAAPIEARGVAADPEGPTAGVDWRRIEKARTGRLATQALPTVDVLVERDGIHRVAFDALREAGLDVSGVTLSDLALTNMGQPVPIRISTEPGRPAYFEFYGQRLDTLYTRTNVYRVVVDRSMAKRIAGVNAAPAWSTLPLPYYYEIETVERDRQYSFAAPNGDPWYDARMLVFRQPKSWTVEFDAVDQVPAPGPAILEVEMYGVTDWPGAGPDHHVLVSVNGVQVADERFDGLTDHPVNVVLPDGVLRDRGNVLEIALPADTGFDFDLVNFDRLRLHYARAFTAKDDVASFLATGAAFEVAGFSTRDIVVYRLTNGVPTLLRNPYVQGRPGAYSVRFAGSGGVAEYVVAAADRVLEPGLALTPEAEDIKSRPAQFLILSHPDFVDGLAPLVQARRASGLMVEVVSTEQVMAQLGHGVFDAAAIREYIRYAWENKGTEAVLLVGGDTYDYLDHLGKGAVGFVPSLYTATDGLVDFAPADPLYADVDDDLVPDLPIGRFPVRTSQELTYIVEKTLAYESKPYGRTAVFAADAHDGQISYTAHSESFISQIPAGWLVERAYIDEVGVAAARTKLLAQLNGGVALTSFTGHSSLTNWTYGGLLSAADVGALANAGRPTVVTQWGCWNTYYVSPSYDTMGHEFMVSGDRGAAAVLGASTLTDASSEQQLGSLLVPRLVTPGVPIGVAIQEAKAALAAIHPELRDVLLGWTLLGDPYLVVEP